MTGQVVPPFDELLAATSRSAVHLEQRDAYTPDDPFFVAWQQGAPLDRAEAEAEWHEMVGEARRRGVNFRRARIVSEPVMPYIRYEHSVTDSTNIAAGELVRWLPRSRAEGLLIPPLDLWVFDDRLVRFGHFAGDGEFLGYTMSTDLAIVKPCAEAFEAVWERAVDHAEYEIR